MKTTQILPLRRTQEHRSAESRALLIGAAIELLHTVGFSNTTTALIAKRAGMTTGALHHHFPTKDDLMFGVLEHAAESIRRRFKEKEHFSGEGDLDVTGLLNHMWSVYGDPEYWATWEVIIGTRSEGVMHPRVVAHRESSMPAILHPWLDRHVFSETGRAEAAALFEFMFIAIRGLGLERFLDKDAAYFRRNLNILAELVGPRLKALSKPSPVH
jgi:AcrR family transcriptional regulator